MSDQRLWLIELQAYDPGVPGVVTKYYATGKDGFLTTPADVPANAFYVPVIRSIPNIQRSISNVGIAYGTLALNNADDALTPLLGYGLDGRSIRILTSDKVNPTYADFTEVLLATMERPELVGDELHVKIVDNKYQLTVPLQTTKFAGSGPGTLEGDADLKDKSKPVCVGIAPNVSPPPVETAKRIYQVSDGLVASIDAVYDRGVRLQFGFPMVASDAANLVTAGCFASNGTIAVTYRPGNGTFYTTTDLETWTARQVIATGLGQCRMTWIPWLSGGVFLFTGSGANGAVYTSPDGITWTAATTSFVGKNPLNHCVGTSSIVVVGVIGATPTIWSSTDGTNYTSRTTNFGGGVTTTSNCAFGNAKFIVTSGTATVPEAVVSTDDGVTWAQLVIPYDTALAVSINADLWYGNGLWVVERNGGLFASSIDAEVWALNPGPFSPSFTVSEFWWDDFSKTWYVFGQNPTNTTKAIYGWSVDGIHWFQDYMGFAGTSTVFQAGSHNGRLAVAVVQVGLAGLYVTQKVKTYANSADLLNDTLAPVAGSYGVFLNAAGSYFRLGADPDGLITADVTEGATAADRTTAKVLGRLFARGARVLTAGDIVALDALNSAEVGIWYGPNENPMLSEAINRVADSAGSPCYIDKAGAFRVKRFDGPAAVADIDIDANDLAMPPTRRPAADPERGIPIFKSTIRYGHNFSLQTTDIAPAVSQSRRAFLTNEWRTASDQNVAVQTAHLQARELVEETLLITSAAAAAEATRRLGLRGVNRDQLDLAIIEMTPATLAIDLFKTVRLAHSRVGGAHRYLVIGIEIDPDNERLSWIVWGPE